MQKNDWAERQMQTLVTLLRKMHNELAVRDRSGEYSSQYLRGFGECSWIVMDYIEHLEKHVK